MRRFFSVLVSELKMYQLFKVSTVSLKSTRALMAGFLVAGELLVLRRRDAMVYARTRSCQIHLGANPAFKVGY